MNLICFQQKFYNRSSNDPSVINVKVIIKCKICIVTKLLYILQNLLLEHSNCQPLGTAYAKVP